MSPSTTLWKREPHTQGKHLVLEQYLNAWYPIMGKWNGRILFVDGFAGPGEYAGGEEGSPVVAMRVLEEHPSRSKMKAHVIFLFIEKDSERFEHLAGLVEQWRPTLKPFATPRAKRGSFDSSMKDVLDYLEEHGKLMAPAFVMIDPFGVKGMPMEMIRRIFKNPRCEVYVSFMWEHMNRFVSESEFETPLDELFGTEEWRAGMELVGDARKNFLHGLYSKQLKAAGAGQVVHFRLFKGNRHKYSIFFGTSHSTGSDRMKRAIWKADPSGGYSFRGGIQDQLVLIDLVQPDFAPLRRALQDRFASAGWVSIEDVQEFVRSDQTIYHGGHVKKSTLKPMEDRELVRVDPKTRKRRGTYPDGCRMKFKSRTIPDT